MTKSFAGAFKIKLQTVTFSAYGCRECIPEITVAILFDDYLLNMLSFFVLPSFLLPASPPGTVFNCSLKVVHEKQVNKNKINKVNKKQSKQKTE